MNYKSFLSLSGFLLMVLGLILIISTSNFILKLSALIVEIFGGILWTKFDLGGKG